MTNNEDGGSVGDCTFRREVNRVNWISQNLGLLSGLLGTIASAGIIKYAFFSVNKNERGVWLRLGNPVYRRDGSLVIMKNGHPGIRPPWVYHLIKVDVAIRTTGTDDMEVVRRLDGGGRESWKATGEFQWQAKDDPESYVKVIFSTKDMDAALEQTVKSIVQRTLKEVLRENEVGTMEGSDVIHNAVADKCREELDIYGVELVNMNVFRLRPVDAAILSAGLLQANGDGEDGKGLSQGAKFVTIAQEEHL